MTRRIEPVETYASLFRWAATYSLLLTDEALYVVRLGPAMGGVGGAEGYLTGTRRQLDAGRRLALGHQDGAQEVGADLGVVVAAPILQKIEARYGQKVAQGVARLEEAGHEALAREKGSFRFARTDVRAFGLGRKGALDTMDLTTSGRDFRFKVAPGGAAELGDFAAAVQAWAGR